MNACNALAKVCQSKRCYIFVIKIENDSSEVRLEECFENVLCILEGKGFKITLKSEQKKGIRQLYEEKCLLAVHFVHFEM